MTKQLFIETIKSIKKQVDHDSKCNKAFSSILDNDYVTGYNNKYLYSAIMNILEYVMQDTGTCWIEWFIWELDFGNKYEPGCATEKNGKNIDLSTPGKLYDFLIENKKEKE